MAESSRFVQGTTNFTVWVRLIYERKCRHDRARFRRQWRSYPRAFIVEENHSRQSAERLRRRAACFILGNSIRPLK